jgi:lipoprotein-releasing system permease protein
MNFLFAWRYFKAKKSTNAINIIARVSVAAIIIGTASLILVLSVFNGFEDLVKSLYSSFYTDLKISPAGGKTISLTERQLEQLRKFPNIRSFSLIAEDKALLQNGQPLTIVNLKGVDSNYIHVSGINDKIVSGNFSIGTPELPSIVLGAGVENALQVQTDRDIVPLSVYIFKKGGVVSVADPQSSLSAENIRTAGTFMIQQDFDNYYAFTNLGFMKEMLGLAPDEYSAAEISLVNPQDADLTRRDLQRFLGDNSFKVETRYEQNKSLYGVIRTEKWVIYGILTMILLVAAFNIVGALTMLVLEKQKDIHVLKALGASDGFVQRIFLSEGVLLAAIGGITGILLALLVGWLQLRFKLIPLQGGSFLIDYYPVKFVATDFLLVAGTIFAVAFAASWIPSRKAAMEPIELKS